MTTGNKFTVGSLLSILEKHTEATGKLKGKIDLLERECKALREKLIELDLRERNASDEIRKELDEVRDLLKELRSLVSNLSIEKLAEALDAADQFYAPQVQEVIDQLNIVTQWVESQEAVSAATITAKWKFWAIVITAFLTQIGIIAGILYK